MKKCKKIIFFMLLLFSVCIISAEDKTAQYFFQKLSFAYHSGFYPGTVQYADKIMSLYPDSIFTGRTMLYEGEAFYKLGRIEDALDVLQKAAKINENDKDLLFRINYWLGMTFYSQKKYTEAYKYLYESCSVTKNKTDYKDYYFNGILYAGKALYQSELYENSIPCFLFVVKNPQMYSSTQYENTLVALFDTFDKTEKFKKIIFFYNGLSAKHISKNIYNILTLYTGKANEILKNYRIAYNLYTEVLSNAKIELATKALVNAYRVSSLHKEEVGEDPGSILAKTSEKFSMFPDVLSVFWSRMGIDAFNLSDYKKAENYFKLSDKEASRKLIQINALYQAEIMMKAGTKISEVESYLKEKAEKTLLIKSDTTSSFYFAFLARCEGLQSNWKQSVLYSNEVIIPDNSSIYWHSFAEYKLGNYEKVVSLLENYFELSSKHQTITLQALYARALTKVNRLKDALGVYESMPAQELKNQIQLDYAETLLLAGKLSKACSEASDNKLPKAKYIVALSLFNQKQWKKSETYFSSFLNEADASLDTEYIAYSLFYRGYARYQQEKFQLAYNDFVNFADNHNSDLVWNARITAAHAAVQFNDFKKAIKQGQKALQISLTQQQIKDSVLLCAGIYTDSKQFSEALELLKPYTKLLNDFGLKSLYQQGLILENKGEINQSDKTFEKITENFDNQPLSEEASYRRGELYYSIGDYKTAIARYKLYLNKYPSGKFIDAAMYFIADSLVKTGFETRALLQYESLLKVTPYSPYVYSSMNKLVTLYSSIGDYSSALNTAKSVEEKYSEQSKRDGIESKIQELEDLSLGIDKKTAAQKQAYEKAGKSTTAKGRHEGTVLAELYYSSFSMRKKAADLASKLYPIQQKYLQYESNDAADNALILAKWNRVNGNNKESAQKYLESAQYFRMNNKAEEAAISLYGAVEAFDAAKMYADSKAAADTLISLYPESRETVAAKAIIGQK